MSDLILVILCIAVFLLYLDLFERERNRKDREDKCI